jgi:hypothetical protein
MRNYTLIFLFIFNSSFLHAEELCKNLKSCADWAQDKTSAKYDLGTMAKRSLKLEKNFDLTEGDPDFLFNFLLLNSELARVKRENGIYQIVQLRELKNYQFPLIKEEETPNALDFYSVELSFSNKNKVKNAMQVLKKYISKEGRILEVADSNKILVSDLGFHLQALRLMAKELNK